MVTSGILSSRYADGKKKKKNVKNCPVPHQHLCRCTQTSASSQDRTDAVLHATQLSHHAICPACTRAVPVPVSGLPLIWRAKFAAPVSLDILLPPSDLPPPALTQYTVSTCTYTCTHTLPPWTCTYSTRVYTTCITRSEPNHVKTSRLPWTINRRWN